MCSVYRACFGRVSSITVEQYAGYSYVYIHMVYVHLLFFCGDFQMECHMEIDLELSYYNETLAVWEPLIEPISVSEGTYRPWKLYIKVKLLNSC